MRPRSAYTFFIVLGFVLILAAVTVALHYQEYDAKLVAAFVGVGLYVMLIALWMFNKTGIVGIERPHQYLAATTLFIVLGFLLILAAVTLYLMDPAGDVQLLAVLSALGVFFMILGVLINFYDKRTIRIDRLKD